MPVVRFVLGLLGAAAVAGTGSLLWGRFAAFVDPFLVVAVLVARHGRPERALAAGTAAGWAADALSGGPFGLFGFADAAVAYAGGLAARRLALDRPESLAGLFAASAAAQGVLLAVLGIVFRDFVGLPGAVEILGRVATTSLLGLGWLLVAGSASRRWSRWRKRPRSGVRSG